MYKMARLIRRVLRRIFGGETPSWATDIYQSAKLVNFFELLPTLLAIALTPNHFFRRIDLLLKKRPSGVKKSIYTTPIHLITSIATLMLSVKWLASFLPAMRFKLLLAGLLVAMPLLLPLFSAALGVLLGVCVVLAIVGWMAGFEKVSSGTLRVAGSLSYLLVPISPSTYTSLGWRRAAWCALYFYGYLIAFPIFIVGAISFLFYYAGKHGDVAQWTMPSFAFLGDISFIVSLVVLAVILVLGRIVVFPYSALLVESLRRPTWLTIRWELRELRGAIRDLTRYCNWMNHRALVSDSAESVIKGAYPRLVKAWENFPNWWSSYVIRYSVPREWQAKQKVAILAMTAIAGLMEAARPVFLEREQMRLLATIWLEATLPAEREEVKRRVLDWYSWAAPFDWEKSDGAAGCLSSHLSG